MATAPVPLGVEPSQPDERAEKHLPPKSYADAITTNENGGTNGSLAPLPKQSGPRNDSNGTSLLNGDKRQLDENKVIFQKRASQNGEPVLTSVKPDDSYEESLKHNKEIAPRETQKPETKQKKQDPPKSQLRSGRRAGAGWQTSA